jgi:hypothetical protein
MIDRATAWRRYVASHVPEILSFVALAGAGALFMFHSVSAVMRGLSHADDAYVALAAKSVAFGVGYGLPNSSHEFVPFDVAITTGPSMILPLSAAIAILGPLDRLPGAISLGLFALQVAAIGFLVARRFGIARTAAFGATLLLLLILGSRSDWLYGVFMGETITLGFVVLAAVALALTTGTRGASFAGLCAGLAVTTKLIAVFPIAGLALVWLYLQWRAHSRESGWRRRTFAFVVAAAAPVVAFEMAKLLALGWDGYVANWIATMQYSGSIGVAPTSLADLPGLILRTIDTHLLSLKVAIAVGIGFALLLRLRGSERDPPGDLSRLAVLLAGAGVVQWLYLIGRFSVQPRYLFIGVGLLLFMAALAVLALERRARVLAFVVVAGAALILNPNALLWSRQLIDADVHTERLAVIRLLDGSPQVPYAADHWSSIHSVVFALPDAGTWAWGQDATRFVGQRMFVVVDRQFAERREFLLAVEADCALVTPAAIRLAAYDCDRPFWNTFLRPAAISAQAPAFVSENPPVVGGDCNIDFLGSESPGGKARAIAGTTVPLYGWAADLANGLPPLAIAVVLRDGSGTQRYATLQAEDRPDLATHFGVPALSATGFKAGLDLTGVPSGDYRLAVLFSTADRVLSCDSRLTLTVESPS